LCVSMEFCGIVEIRSGGAMMKAQGRP
jgi:hypothetical protein